MYIRLTQLVSRFACNTRVITDTSPSPPVCRIKIAVTKTYYQIIKERKQTKTNFTSSGNQMVIR